jgi:hypothetical protein
MKNMKLILIILFVLTLSASCEKLPFDFRNKYLGNWKFDVGDSHETYNTTQGFRDTTIYRTFHGEIKYGSKHNKILFNSAGYSREFPIEKNGQIIPENDYGPGYTEYGGFEGNDIFRYQYSHRWGGSRQYVATNIEGVRE